MLVKDVMTRNPACCKPSDTLLTVATQMVDRDCGIVPVCEESRIVGVITDRDLVCRAMADRKDPATTPASAVMTRGICVIGQDAHIGSALDLMESELVRRLPVVDGNGRLVGIVSEADLVARLGTLKVARAMRAVAQRTRQAAFAEL